ncbi:PREDICTED: thyrotropin-releasing hormone receptor-like, partial [Priapulus caudatus]|uniref:Thyrotropin-releasing hormone receptor n=1 Tax=Priapulus caudatus TaxID=37621 RepID=A0ABM1E656_PRICU
MSHGGDDNATDAFAAADVFLAGANATLSPPQYYSYSYRVIATLFCSIIFFVGVVGNVMVVLVVWRSKTMHTPTNCYLMSLAIADCMVLISAVPSVITGFFLVKDAWVFGSVACSIFVFLNYLGINASSLSITAFTVERYIGICHPMKAQIMCTMERANKIIVGVWIFAMAYNSPWLPLTQMVTNEYAVVGTVSSCGFKLDRDMYTWVYMADFILFYVVPLLLSCVMYGLIGRMLFYNAMPQEACMQRTSNGEIFYSIYLSIYLSISSI